MAVNWKSRKPMLGNVMGGLSGTDIKPVAFRCVHQVAQVCDIPIIGVADLLALSDLLNETGLPPNDCQQVDLLEDGIINDWDLFVLVDLVMAGGN